MGAQIPNLQIQNPFKIHFRDQYWNGRDYSYSYALEPTIWKLNELYIRLNPEGQNNQKIKIAAITSNHCYDDRVGKLCEKL